MKIKKIFIIILIFCASLAIICTSIIGVIKNTDLVDIAFYKEDKGAYKVSDIIPSFEYVEIWKNSDVDITFNSKNKCNDSEQKKIISTLIQMNCTAITKKQKNSLLGKSYPDKTNGINCIYLFEPNYLAGMYIYGPEFKYWSEFENTADLDEQRNITNFSIVQNEETKQVFLTVYYDVRNKYGYLKSYYTYYLLHNTEALLNLSIS